MSESEKVFGPSAILTPANGVTVARLLAGPAFAVIVAELHRPSWMVFTIWCILAVSDGADGQLARRQGTTRSGAFLDPLADKFLVIGALAALAAAGKMSVIAVALIGIREAAMSVFRVRVGKRGISIPARLSAKLKTVVQDVVVGFALSPLMENHHEKVVTITLWCAVGLTIYSGIEYVFDWRRGAARELGPVEQTSAAQQAG